MHRLMNVKSTALISNFGLAVNNLFFMYATACHLSLSWNLAVCSLKVHFTNILQPTHRSSKRSLSPMFSHCYPVFISHSSYVCHIFCQSYTTSFHHHYNVWRGIQIVWFLIAQFSRASCYCRPLHSKYLPQHPVTNILGSSPKCEKLSFKKI